MRALQELRAVAILVLRSWHRVGPRVRGGHKPEPTRGFSAVLMRLIFAALIYNFGFTSALGILRDDTEASWAATWAAIGSGCFVLATTFALELPSPRMPTQPLKSELLELLPLSSFSKLVLALSQAILTLPLTLALAITLHGELSPRAPLWGAVLLSSCVFVVFGLAGACLGKLLRRVFSTYRASRLSWLSTAPMLAGYAASHCLECVSRKLWVAVCRRRARGDVEGAGAIPLNSSRGGRGGGGRSNTGQPRPLLRRYADEASAARRSGWPSHRRLQQYPTVTPGLRAGFFLPGSQGVNPASGSSIRGFVFDGKGVSNANLEPLSFGVFARFASDVVVERNHFIGTVQAVTNTAGDRWRIQRNRIERLTLLDCTKHCTGGDGIVIALARSLVAPGGDAAPLNRPEDNVVADNSISGTPPDAFGVFSMVGVLLLSADHTSVLSNRLDLRDNPSADAKAQGIVVSNTCCGQETGFLPGSRFSVLSRNDTRRSEVGIVVEGSGGTNTLGLVLHRNRGSVELEGGELTALSARRVLAPPRAQPTL